MLSNYSDYTDTILQRSAFADSSSLAKSSRAAYYSLLFSSILSGITLIMYVWFRPLGLRAFVPPSGPFIHGRTWALFVCASAAVLAAIFVLIGSVIWIAIIEKAKDVNSWKIQSAQHPLGIVVYAGGGLYFAGIAFGFLVACAIPLTIKSVLLPSVSYNSRALIHFCCDVASLSRC